MGSSSSKAAKTAAGAASRRYPTRIPPNTPSNPPPQTTSTPAQAAQPSNSNTTTTTNPPPATNPTPPGPTIHPQTQARSTKDESIKRDAADPDFAASLRRLGPVMPSSTMSNSSTFSAAARAPPSSSSPSAAVAGGGGSHSSDPAGYTGSVFPDPRENPAVLVLQARERIAAEAEREFGVARTGGKGEGRRFVDVGVIRDVLVMRDGKGLGAAEIEEKLGLRKGVVAMLSRVGEARVGRVDGGDAGLY